MSEKKCPICAAGSEGLILTESYLSGKVAFRQLCEYFNVTKQQALEHIENHHPHGYVSDNQHDELQAMINYRNKFFQILLNLEIWISKLNNKSPDEVDHKFINSLTRLITEYRQVLTTLAEFDGKINRNQVIVELQEYNKKLDEIVTLIVEELCDECRERVLGKLENVLAI